MSRLRAVLVVNLALLKHANPGDVQVVACRHGAESHRRHILLFRATLLHRIGDGRGPGRYRSAARIVRPCVTETPACLGRTLCTKNGVELEQAGTSHRLRRAVRLAGLALVVCGLFAAVV